MSEQEKFLARWSRRKLETTEDAVPGADEQAVAQPEDRGAKDAHALSPPAAAPEPVFDLKSLPSLESIGPNSDIRAFLRPGVPGALSRAALRRAWVADPAIRDFVGLAENSWDFTVPNEIIGFGPLDPGEAARQLARFLGTEASGQIEKLAASQAAQISQSEPADAAPAQTPDQAQIARVEATEVSDGETSGDASHDDEGQQRSNGDDAVQQNEAAGEADLAPTRRGHGGALPE